MEEWVTGRDGERVKNELSRLLHFPVIRDQLPYKLYYIRTENSDILLQYQFVTERKWYDITFTDLPNTKTLNITIVLRYIA